MKQASTLPLTLKIRHKKQGKVETKMAPTMKDIGEALGVSINRPLSPKMLLDAVDAALKRAAVTDKINS